MSGQHCAALRKDGSPCTSWAISTSDKCLGHSLTPEQRALTLVKAREAASLEKKREKVAGSICRPEKLRRLDTARKLLRWLECVAARGLAGDLGEKQLIGLAALANVITKCQERAEYEKIVAKRQQQEAQRGPIPARMVDAQFTAKAS